LWTVPDGRLVSQIGVGQNYGKSGAMSFSPDSRSFAVATSDGIVIFDLATGMKGLSFQGNAPHALAFSPDGKCLTNGQRAWNIATGMEVSRFQFQPGEDDNIRGVAFSPDGKSIATGTGGQNAFLWDPATGQRLKTLRQKRARSYAALEDLFGHDFRMSVSFSDDGNYLAVAGGDVQARVWDIEKQMEIARLAHQGMVTWAAFTNEGQEVLTAGLDGTVRLWEALSGHELTRITENQAPQRDSEASSAQSGTYIVVGASRHVSLWESATGRASRRLLHKTAATDITFSHDGKLLATCDTTTAQVWDAASGELIAPPMVQREPNVGASWRDQLKSVAFSADGKLLATANGDQTARIWDVSTGSEIARIHPKNTGVASALLSPDGKLMATASSGMGARGENVDLWEAPDLHLAFHQQGASVLFSP